MVLIVGEAIVAYQRDGDGPWTGPWPSGSPAICAYVLGRLGVPVEFAGGIGRDEHGDVMVRGLTAGGAGIRHLAVSPTLPTAYATITYRGADREFDFHVAGSAAVAVTEADLGDRPEQTGWLHLSGSALIFGEPLAGTALAALRRAKAAGARISVDPNVRPDSAARDALAEVLPLADYVLPSEGELEALGVRAEDLPGVVCTTYGPGGAVVAGTRVDAPAVDAVDTDGAGDSFAAGFIAACLGGADPVEAAREGVRVAAAAVQVVGPMTVVFDR